MSDSLELLWKRSDSTEYPKVWCTFKARDVDSDKLVEYRIQDLPQSRAEDVFNHMWTNYIQDEPIGQALGGGTDPVHFEDYKLTWVEMVKQRTPLVCFKAGSDDIIGVNMIFVMSKDDHFMEKCYKHFKSQITKDLFDIVFLLYENFDPFAHYNVDKYLTSFGLSVDRKYRGRGIGEQFLAARKLVIKEFGLNFTHTIFTSDFSNHNADMAGFKENVTIKYEDVVKTHPRFKIAHIKSIQMATKTLMC